MCSVTSRKFDITSLSDLEKFALVIKDQIQVIRKNRTDRGVTLILSGELAAGKTTFVSMIAKLYGADIREVASPTYVLQKIYNCTDGAVLSHWDLYRAAVTPDEFFESPSQNEVRLVEWGEKFRDELEYDGTISFELMNTGKREAYFQIKTPV